MSKVMAQSHGMVDACQYASEAYKEGVIVGKDLNKAKIFYERTIEKQTGEGCTEYLKSPKQIIFICAQLLITVINVELRG